MWTRITALLLLAAFAMQTFQKNLLVLDYVANTSLYAKRCENKARPLLKCKGKCQLMKKLQAEEKKEQQNPDRKGENKTTTLYPLPALVTVEAATAKESKNVYKTFHAKPPVDRAASFFHPPAQA